MNGDWAGRGAVRLLLPLLLPLGWQVSLLLPLLLPLASLAHAGPHSQAACWPAAPSTG